MKTTLEIIGTRPSRINPSGDKSIIETCQKDRNIKFYFFLEKKGLGYVTLCDGELLCVVGRRWISVICSNRGRVYDDRQCHIEEAVWMTEKVEKRRGHGFSKTEEAALVAFVEEVQVDTSTRLPLCLSWSVGSKRYASPEIQALFLSYVSTRTACSMGHLSKTECVQKEPVWF